MQNNQQYHLGKEMLPCLGDETGYSASTFDSLFPTFAECNPFHGIEFQPSDVCPKNFVIFDQTNERSQVMYHPALAHKLDPSALKIFSSALDNDHNGLNVSNFETETSCSHQEDSDEIDALLSSEEEQEKEEYDEEEEEDSSPDSCSSYVCNNLGKNISSGSISRCSNGEKKRQKMKKMMKVLRGLVPGGEHMNTVSVLDEAVTHLKSLKIEAKKLGAGNFVNRA